MNTNSIFNYQAKQDGFENGMGVQFDEYVKTVLDADPEAEPEEKLADFAAWHNGILNYMEALNLDEDDLDGDAYFQACEAVLGAYLEGREPSDAEVLAALKTDSVVAAAIEG